MKHREPWPRADREHLAACHFCDALHDAPEVEEGKTAYCGNCGAVLYRNRPSSLDRSVAFGVAVLFLMVVAQGFPFMSLDAKGVRTAMTLTQAAGSLMAEGSVLLGMAVAVFTLVAPVVMASESLMFQRQWHLLLRLLAAEWPNMVTARCLHPPALQMY